MPSQKTNQRTRLSNKKSTLRLIGGKWRGRRLTIADVPGLRPTGDRIRETVFNWLQGDIAGSHCLDLFAGSGALGLESLSRGAATSTLIEQHARAAQQLREHCQHLGAQQATIIQSNTLEWLQQQTIKHHYHIAFIDPPFEANLWKQTLEYVDKHELMVPQAAVYIESPQHVSVHPPHHWRLEKDKSAGDVRYQLYRIHD